MAHEGDRPVRKPGKAGDHRRVLSPRAVAVQLDEVVEDPLDVVQRVRTVRVTRELDVLPDLLVARLRDPLQLLLEARQLARDARAAEEPEPLQPAEPVA